MDSNRIEYSVENYDFYEDEKFQEFFKSKLPNHYIRRDKYIRILIACKEEWIKQLNNEIHKQELLEFKKQREEHVKKLMQVEPCYDSRDL